MKNTEPSPRLGKSDTAKLVAVIDVGSTAIRMVIAEIKSGEWKTVDRAEKLASLGRDVFLTNYITRETTLEVVRILNGYCELIRGWKIDSNDIRIIATSAIREAKNRDTFVDRVYLRTGLKIDIIEGIEENQLTYLAVQHAVKEIQNLFARSNSLIIEVGGGSSDVMLLRRGKMVAAHSLRLGSVRVEQQLIREADNFDMAGDSLKEYLQESIRGMKEILNAEMELSKIRFFVAVGGDARLVAARVGEKTNEHFSVIPKENFNDFLTYIQGNAPDENMQNLGITYGEAEILPPALMIYKLFLDSTSAEKLYVPDVSIREGVLLSFAMGTNKAVEKQFYSQVIASAVNIGRKYHFDEKHAKHVTKLALKMFDQLADEHGLDQHGRLLMEVAGILHDIGNYVRASGHHKHSQYLISNSEIFGFSSGDIRILSNIVRYHRKSSPSNSHTNFISLKREDRLTVMKLASILRVADALDRSHIQKVNDIKLERNEDELTIRCSCPGDMSVERFGLSLKGDMFEEVFGYKILLS
jgi:exopolyphosphatase/guanosine-5'-triphosphate,3'-diphosphate pyrophosphatase